MSRAAVETIPGPANPYLIKEVRFPSGERMPLMMRRSTGVGIEAPTCWITSERRPLGLQANTLQQELRNLMMLYLWADARGVDPVKRLQAPAFLSLAELNDLDRFCRKRVEEAVAEVNARTAVASNVVRLATERRPKLLKPPGRMQVRNRMSSIYSFMDHVSYDHLSRLRPGTEAHRIYGSARTEMLEKWAKRYKSLEIPNDANPRQGLDAAASERLREVIRPEHLENPWQPEVRHRNGLMILMLWSLGLRRGELLALQTSDIKFAPDRAFVTVVRRPDNPLDKRNPRPAVKTRGREVAIEPKLADLLRGYILGQRREHPAARKHPFVFVSAADGAPLNPSSFNKLFQALRRRVPDLPDDLSPHVMRHSWNDAFSVASDRASPRRTDVEKTQEQRMRSYLMGWAPNSQMAAKYSTRWTAEAANERSLAIQRNQKFLNDEPPEFEEA